MKKVKMGSVDAIDLKSYRGTDIYKEVGRTYSSLGFRLSGLPRSWR